MDPIKLIAYIAGVGVATLIVMGGAGFYLGYSAGRGDMAEIKDFLANSTFNVKSPDSDRAVTAALDFKNQEDFAPVLTEIRVLGAQMRTLEKRLADNAPDLDPVLAEIRVLGTRLGNGPGETGAPADIGPVLAELKSLGEQVRKLPRQGAAAAPTDLTPVLTEIRSLNEQLRKLERLVGQQPAPVAQEDGKLREEIGRLRQLVASAGEQLNACQVRLAALETGGARASDVRPQPAVNVEPQTGAQGGTVVLFDSFYLKKDQNKAFEDVNLTVALQGVASRSARIDINQQTVSIAFGERKEIVYNNMTCELNLMETDLSASRARFNIACKR
jgi:hypothetical protein